VTFGKFNLVGLLGAALQLFLIWLFTKHFHAPAFALTPAAVEVVLLHNFVWHEHFTWGHRRHSGSALSRLGRFQLGNGVISVAGNTLLTYVFVEFAKAGVLPSAIGSIAVCSLANFLVADRWVYAAGRV